MSFDEFVLQVFNSLSFGALLFIVASGFTLIFGLMRIVNLAHGSLYLLGGYIGLSALRTADSFWLALVMGALAMGLLGVVLDRGLMRIVRGNEEAEVLLTVGLSLIAADLALAVWGGDPILLAPPGLIDGSTSIAGVTYPDFRLFVVGFAAIIAAMLWYIQERTRLGAIVRAGVDDREMVAALGININAVFTGVFALGAALAGAAGVVGGAFVGLYPGADAEILTYALVVVVIGGLGSLSGAFVGSLLVGAVYTFGQTLVPSLAYFVLFAPMALVLILRPRGLFGRA